MAKPNATPSQSPGEVAPDEEFLSATAFVPVQLGDDTANNAADAQASAVPVTIPPELIAKMLGPTFRVIFGTVAQSRGETWVLKPFEEDALSSAWTPLVGHLLSKLGSTEQGMLALAVVTTGAVVGGKIGSEAIKRASSTASTRTRTSEDSSAYSASAEAEKPPEPSNWSPEQYA